MKIPNIFVSKKKKTLRATAVRKPLRIAATADYDDLAEPNMKLSRALLIVLLLHVVAVSGIIAFNAIKTHQSNSMPAMRPAGSADAGHEKTQPSVEVSGPPKEAAHPENARVTKVSVKTNSKEERKTEHAKPSSVPAESGKTHVVARGETPLTIAKKFKVPFDDLLAINHIDDPHKLQIGQKLIIPAKPKPKKSE